MTDYKASKEAFVSGTTGSSIAHVNMVLVLELVRAIRLKSRFRLIVSGADFTSFSPAVSSSAEQADKLSDRICGPRDASAPSPHNLRDETRNPVPHYSPPYRRPVTLPSSRSWHTSAHGKP